MHSVASDLTTVLIPGGDSSDTGTPVVGSFERGSLQRASQARDEHTTEEELKGLTDADVLRRREESGWNEIPEKIIPIWYMVVKQLMGPMPYMIEAATVLSVALLQWAPFGILLAILIINTAIGFHEEKKAKDALDGLKSEMISTVRLAFVVPMRTSPPQKC